MDELLEKIKNISTKDAIKIEQSDKQYISLKNLFEKLNSPLNPTYQGGYHLWQGNFYLALILANSIICYQLSSSWENYWEEFSNYFSKIEIKNQNEIIKNLATFIKQSKWNKRFIETKIKRLEKLNIFLQDFIWNEKYFYENMKVLQEKLAKTMNQKITDKTIVFAVKMFSYWARNVFDNFIQFPFDISIPIDSRLTNLYEKYNKDKNITIEKFYDLLAKNTQIPPLHLDAVLWVNYENLIK